MKSKAAFIVLLAACGTASAQEALLTAEALNKFNGRSVGTATYPKASFNVVRAGNMAFGLIGALAAIGSGNDMVKAQGIEDPAAEISKSLAARLAAQVGTKTLPTSAVESGNSLEAALTAIPNADFIVDVRTDGWGYSYVPTAWTHYRVGYVAKLRVIDVASKSVLAEASCPLTLGKPREPTDDQLMANKAALLKYYLQQAQFTCTDQFAKNVFGWAPQPRPTDALTDPFDNLRADDEAAIPDIQAKGKEDYKAWLAMSAPKAFAIADNGLWSYASSLKPQDTNAAVEPIARALATCKRNAKRDCQLFAVNNKYVLGSEFAAKAEADFQASLGIANFAALPAQGSEANQGQRTPSNFAKLEDVDLVPYLYERGRKGYEDYLKAPMPKAFAVSPSGYFAASVGAVSRDPTLPLDVADRALTICNKNSPTVCKLYAVGNDVVYTRD